MINQDLFYRRHGVRLPQQLMAPTISLLNKFEFPRNSLYNHLTFDGVNNGPASDEYFLRSVTKLILMDHVVDLTSNKGSPRKVNKAILPYIREYHSKNRRFRYVKDLVSIHRDENTLLVINFDLVTKTYRYIRSMYSEYYKWWNIQSTVWTHASLAASTSNRNQYYFVTLPKTLPSVPSLNFYSKVFNSSLIKVFPSQESLFILEVWKWLSIDHRDDSIFSGLTKQSLDKINIVYQESGSWIMFNLGVLESWRYINEESDEHQKVRIPPDQLQKRFLRMLMTLMSVRSSPIEEQNETDSQEEPMVKADQVELVHEHELDEETRLEKADRTLESLDKDLSELEHIESNVIVDDSVGGPKLNSGKIVVNDFHTEVSTEGTIVGICDKLAEDGLITAAVYRNLVNSSKNYQSIVAPDGKSTLEDFVKIAKEDIAITESQAIPDNKTVIDKSMLKSSLLKFDQTYIGKVLDKDVAGMVVNIQRGGVILSNYTVEKVEDMLGNYENHVLRVRPVEGVASTIRFKLPTVDEDGTIKYNNSSYKLRKQRGDLPIRKIGSNTVALTSYYGKTFVSRNTKKVNDYSSWLNAKIMQKGLDNTDSTITELSTASVFDNTFDCPRLYSIIAMSFRSFVAVGYKFNFDYTKREELFGADTIKAIEIDGLVVIAKDGKQGYLAVDNNDAIYEIKNGFQTLRGTIENVLSIDQDNSPVEFSEIRIFGSFVPVCFFLSYQLGLSKLIELLRVEPRRVPTGERVGLDVDEYALVFSDSTLVFNKGDKLASMILAGFMQYDKVLKKYPVSTMDKPNVYLNLLESSSLTARYLREMDLMNNLFVDPITKELLTEMGEPTTVRGLLVRSTALLLKDQHPDQMDMKYMRIKGYERLSGAVYSELVQSIRAHGARAGKASRPLEMHPYAVWKRVVQDPSMSMISDMNPIQNLKETEAVTFSGVGGRSARSLVKGSRKYHSNDMGVISESTVDSGNVGVITYLSADPQFKTLRGTTKLIDINKIDPTSIMSTSALMAPGSSNDDPKRVNFAGIQNAHGLSCKGYTQPSVRTGYEQVLAHRTSNLFAYTAKQDGAVISKTATGIQVKYNDGTIRGHEIGRRFGSAAGLTIPHNVVSDLKVGDKFKEGDIVSYNDGFFERDILNPKQVIHKKGVTAKTVLYESSQTLEDASSISKRLAELLSTKLTKVRTIVVKFDQEIKKLIKVGDKVEPESILCVIEDAVTSSSNLFDDESLNTLRLLSNQTPTAKVKGIVEKIEVFYHGDKEDMSGTLKVISSQFDKELTSRNRSIGGQELTGSVNGDLRVDGEPLALDSIAVKIYITSDVMAGIGDKGVFCNQMKTVFSEVLPREMRTEKGEIIDAVFGQKSIQDRIVLSPALIGTTTTLLSVIGKQAFKLYKKETSQ